MTGHGHLTIYRYEPAGAQEHGARAFENLAGDRVGIFSPGTFGPSLALKKIDARGELRRKKDTSSP